MHRHRQSYAVDNCGQNRSRMLFAQADVDLRCPLTESADTVVYIEEQRMSGSDCTDAHARLDLCCSHMAQEPFSYDKLASFEKKYKGA